MKLEEFGPLRKKNPAHFGAGFFAHHFESDDPAGTFAAVFFRAARARFAAGGADEAVALSAEACLAAAGFRGAFFAAARFLPPACGAAAASEIDACSAVSTASLSSGAFAVLVGAAAGVAAVAGVPPVADACVPTGCAFGATSPTLRRCAGGAAFAPIEPRPIPRAPIPRGAATTGFGAGAFAVAAASS
jgi:hypothetical protein